MKDPKSKYGANCSCSCCKWHDSSTVRFLLALLFFALVIDLAAQVVFGVQPYLYISMISFIGIILLIGFIGWVLSMACSCRGRHWIHGPDRDPELIAKERYAAGEISRTEYLRIVKDLK